MRFKHRRSTNINLLTKQLEQIAIDKAEPEKVFSGSGSNKIESEPETKEIKLKTKMKRGVKKDALIDTTKLLSI